MNDYKNISDLEINQLLKKRLLEQGDDALLEAEAKRVFATEALITPSAKKEKELIKKLTRSKSNSYLSKWILPFVSAIIISSVIFITGIYTKNNIPVLTASKNNANLPTKKTEKADRMGNETKNSTQNNFFILQKKSDFVPSYPAGDTSLLRKGQVIEKILKENADCSNPILVRDTIVFSPHSPTGYGNSLEIHDNQPDDLLHFENEHNTVWYRFTARSDGYLTFDIVPVDPDDDYDFMLYKYDGGDFHAKVATNRIQPIRSCISRNDKRIHSMTGLSLNEHAESFIHSGVGASYVKFIHVEKGETYFLLVDNVYENGNGHSIRFHYKCFAPDDLFVGKRIFFNQISFVSDAAIFLPGSNYQEGINQIYAFLEGHPTIKVEIQGHVNYDDGIIDVKGNKTKGQKLSEARSIAVYNQLVECGINPKRMETSGYSGTRKKIRNPKSIKESYENVRVEVMILSLDFDNKLAAKSTHEKNPVD